MSGVTSCLPSASLPGVRCKASPFRYFLLERANPILLSFVTFSSLALFIGFLVLFFRGVLRKADEKPRAIALTCRKCEGERIWISGVCRRLLQSLPQYPYSRVLL